MKAICFGFLIGALGFAGEQSVFAQDKEMAVNVGGRPNIVVFITDDQNQSDLGGYGNSDVRNTNMERLASEGMRFTYAYAAFSICTPSRGRLLQRSEVMRGGE